MRAEEVTEPLYFGCVDSAGHFVSRKDGTHVRGTSHSDFLEKNDGKLAPLSTNEHGLPVFHRFVDFTIIAMWDYSVDSRPKSNSMFLIPGIHSDSEAVRLARLHFPTIWDRIQPHLIDEEEMVTDHRAMKRPTQIIDERIANLGVDPGGRPELRRF